MQDILTSIKALIKIFVKKMELSIMDYYYL